MPDGTAATVEGLPPKALVDQRHEWRIRGLRAGEEVTVRALATSGVEEGFESWATLRAERSGTIDMATARPLAGSYDDADPMGLFWSMQPGRATSPPSLAGGSGRLTTAVQIEVSSGGAVATSTTIERTYVEPGVTRQEVRGEGLVASVFCPPGDGPFPAVLSLGGSGGGLDERRAALLASHGLLAMELAYFDADGLPDTLLEIPLEYFRTALRALGRNHRARYDRVAVVGSSRGGELALLLGATFGEVAAVVAYVPSGVVWSAISRPEDAGRPAWTLGGEPVPAMPSPAASASASGATGESPDAAGPAASLVQDYLQALEDRPRVEAATIPVERIGGPVLLISARDDRLWPSVTLAEIAHQRLREHQHPYPYEHLSYAGSGHMIRWPYTPPLLSVLHPIRRTHISLGGTVAGTSDASRDSWSRTVAFLGGDAASAPADVVSPDG